MASVLAARSRLAARCTRALGWLLDFANFVGFVVLTDGFRCLVFLWAPSTIRESIELNTRTLISCERDMVRGKMVVFASVMHEAYHELKI